MQWVRKRKVHARLEVVEDVNLDAEELLKALLCAVDLDEVEFERGPVRLDGGCSADIFRFRLSAGPTDLRDRDLVLRLPRSEAACTDEMLIQSAVADLGYPAPAVARSGQLDCSRTPRSATLHSGGPYMIMTFVEGRLLFHAQSPLRAFRRVPPRLAELMLALHNFDPESVRQSLAEAGVSVVVGSMASI
jgi:aminoglycoside phosphotransferase (APT) family kinase protein